MGILEKIFRYFRIRRLKNRVWWKHNKIAINRIILRGIKYFIYFVCAPFLTLGFLLESQKIADHFDKKGSWDAMSFTGAIVGGTITLIAVKLTLNNQFRMDFMQK